MNKEDIKIAVIGSCIDPKVVLAELQARGIEDAVIVTAEDIKDLASLVDKLPKPPPITPAIVEFPTIQQVKPYYPEKKNYLNGKKLPRKGKRKK